MSDSLRPHELHSPWNSPGHNTGVGNFSLLQGIFPNQGSNPGLLHCRWILCQLSHQGSPREGLISTTALLWEDYVNRTTWHIILRDFFFSTQPNFSIFLPSFIHFFSCAGPPLLRGLFPSCSRQELLSGCGAQASRCPLAAEHGL